MTTLNRKLHILLPTAWYKKDKGTPNFVEEQARMLQKEGHRVTVLHAYLKGSFIGTLKSRETDFSIVDDSGIITIRIGTAPILPKTRKLSYHKLIKKCSNYIHKYIDSYGKPDIIHSHSLFMGGVVAFHLSRKFEIPFFHTEHTSGLIFDPKRYTVADIRLLKRVYKHSKKLFFVSNYSKNHTLQNFNIEEKENMLVLHNVVNELFFERRKLNQDTYFSYLIIAPFRSRKGHKLLLEAWFLLLKEYPNSKLTIAGEGSLKNEMKEFALQLKINNSIRWLNKLSRLEVKNEIQKTNIVISASQVETFGLTIVEAHAMGKPTLATNSGGVRDTITEINGLITDQNINSFTEGLITIQKNYKNYDSQLIREDCYQKFSEETIYNKLIKHYSSVMDDKKK